MNSQNHTTTMTGRLNPTVGSQFRLLVLVAVSLAFILLLAIPIQVQAQSQSRNEASNGALNEAPNSNGTPVRITESDVRSLVGEVKAAGQMYQAKQYEAAAEKIAKVEAAIANAQPANNGVKKSLVAIRSRVNEAKRRLRRFLPAEPAGAPPAVMAEGSGTKAEGSGTKSPAGSGTRETPAGSGTRSANAGSGTRVMLGNAETVSFVDHLAPLIEEHCVGCHTRGDASARLNMDSFAGITAGGRNGALFAPGAAQGSLLLGKLRGTAEGDPMPQDADPLPDEVIAMFERWIQQGARFDGDNRQSSMTLLMAARNVQVATHEEVAAQRATGAQALWQLGMPGITPTRMGGPELRWFSDLPKARLDQLAEQSPALAAEIARALELPAGEPLVKGGMTIFVMPRRYDYSEFAQMVDKVEPPKSQFGYFQFNGLKAHAVIYPARRGEFADDALLMEQMAGLTAVSRGLPLWFARGFGREMASRTAPRDTRVRGWRKSLPAAASGVSAKDFIYDKVEPEQAAIISYGLVKSLISKPQQMRRLLHGLETGETFEAVFRAVYGGTPLQSADYFLRSKSSRR